MFFGTDTGNRNVDRVDEMRGGTVGVDSHDC
jgi:hypothetical protein